MTNINLDCLWPAINKLSRDDQNRFYELFANAAILAERRADNEWREGDELIAAQSYVTFKELQVKLEALIDNMGD